MDDFVEQEKSNEMAQQKIKELIQKRKIDSQNKKR